MREEKVTINFLNWLESKGWSIICYDFPQSGTGLMIHPNSNLNQNEKNKGGIIPDIIAVKDSIAVFFENKDRFVKSDFEKIIDIKTSGDYSENLDALLKDYNISEILYGIGIPSISKEINKSKANLDDIDFLLSVDIENNVTIHHDINGVFSNA